ncbi:uncharacterized protein BDR25DRAFT_352572 [Lindgomyces ingoldianus]|uniref:Uncharacterized protein n=1 Tax=Lindgomyces ingoldianus TaxID=673940 RepID=A0ACB6R3U2_9PLEO|nr:uncharacterized protein BDR25DRAFT_352572 [Lindgomyces ingoldianus]KAF2473106.1 hypothetical protein BDR25DRAFT_352572 [Lindgomyces ingoldianus]
MYSLCCYPVSVAGSLVFGGVRSTKRGPSVYYGRRSRYIKTEIVRALRIQSILVYREKTPDRPFEIQRTTTSLSIRKESPHISTICNDLSSEASDSYQNAHASTALHFQFIFFYDTYRIQDVSQFTFNPHVSGLPEARSIKLETVLFTLARQRKLIGLMEVDAVRTCTRVRDSWAALEISGVNGLETYMAPWCLPSCYCRVSFSPLGLQVFSPASIPSLFLNGYFPSLWLSLLQPSPELPSPKCNPAFITSIISNFDCVYIGSSKLHWIPPTQVVRKSGHPDDYAIASAAFQPNSQPSVIVPPLNNGDHGERYQCPGLELHYTNMPSTDISGNDHPDDVVDFGALHTGTDDVSTTLPLESFIPGATSQSNEDDS